MIFRILLYGLLFLVSIVLQSTILHFFEIGGAKPDLLLVFVVLLAILKGKKAGASIGFFFGLLEDLVIGKYIGMQALIKMITGFLIGYLHGTIFQENLAVPIIAAGLGTVLHDTAYFTLLNMIGIELFGMKGILLFIFFSALYNICIALIVYWKLNDSVMNGYLKASS